MNIVEKALLEVKTFYYDQEINIMTAIEYFTMERNKLQKDLKEINKKLKSLKQQLNKSENKIC